ncbi:MAG: sugar ABC transporter permease [Chloroflexota bacterium]|nr:MAG: sugar ABC transporter permease [Chloroflexota bacterium]
MSIPLGIHLYLPPLAVVKVQRVDTRYQGQYDAAASSDLIDGRFENAPVTDRRIRVVIGTRSRLELRERLTFLAFIAPNFLLFGVFVFWPLVFAAYLSLFDWNMSAPIRVFIGFENYRDLINDKLFWKVLGNTARFIGGSVTGTVAIALVLALALNERLRGRSVYRAAVFSPTITTAAAVAIVWQFIFDAEYGLVRALLSYVGVASPKWLGDPAWAMTSLTIVAIWQRIGYVTVIFLAGLQAIPRELYEAAKVDGAGAISRFRHVTLPLLSPITFFVIVTSVIYSFQAFDLIAVMTAGGPIDATNVLSYYLYETAFKFFKAGLAASIALVFFSLVLVLTVLQQYIGRRWVHYA